MLVLQMMLSMLTQFHRKDFVTMTVCTVAFYFLYCPEYVRRRHFRVLVGLAIASLVQDAAWFTLNRDLDEDDEEDGGVERGVKGFSRKMSYLSFALRVSYSNSLVSLARVFFHRSTTSALMSLRGFASVTNLFILFDALLVCVDPAHGRALEGFARLHENR